MVRVSDGVVNEIRVFVIHVSVLFKSKNFIM